MNKFFTAIALTGLLVTATTFQTSPVIAQEFPAQTINQEEVQDIFPPDQHFRARVIEVTNEGQEEVAGFVRKYQDVRLELLTGEERGMTIELRHGSIYDLKETQKVKAGDQIIVTKSVVADQTTYFITDFFRSDALLIIVLAFAGLIIFLTRRQGVMSIIGLAVSVAVITLYTVPSITNGTNPAIVTLITAYSIAVSSILLAHGLHKRTYVALLGTLITLTLSVLITAVLLAFARLSGIGSEEAYTLQLGPFKELNMQGLLFGGIIIGTLGVLDDITTAQAATVEEISRANPELSIPELYKRGFSVGREHIAALVNTLFLAYAGASLPLFLIFTVNRAEPLWMTLNSEYIAEEIVRTLVGSAALVLAVPITTLLAAKLLRTKTQQ